MTFNYSRRVYLGDTDAAGVIYFAKGLEICHEAYEESLAEAGISLQKMICEAKTALPIVHAEIDFVRPVFCGDRLQIGLNSSQVSNSEFAIAYEIFFVDDLNKIVVKAQTRHVCIDPQIRQRMNLPPAMLKWLNCV